MPNDSLSGTTHQWLSTKLSTGWNTEMLQPLTQFQFQQFSTKRFRKEKSSIAKTTNFDAQAVGKAVTELSRLNESAIPEVTVSAAGLINQIGKRNVTTKMIPTAETTEVILLAEDTTRKIPTPKSLKLPNSKITAGERKMMIKSSTVLLVEKMAGLGQFTFLFCNFVSN